VRDRRLRPAAGQPPDPAQPPARVLRPAAQRAASRALPEPGAYFLQRPDDIVLLVQHASPGGAPAHFLDNRQAAADILRACGSDPSLLDTPPDPNPSPPTP